MKLITTVVEDIYRLVGGKENVGWFDASLCRELSADISVRLSTQLGQEARKPTLRLSQMGPKCPKALWHSIHTPELAEALPPWATIKYSFGHILEALVLALAKAAGHDVKGEQDEVSVDGVIGHRDCVLDGCVVDVKSASSFSFQKFKSGSIAHDDAFGYLEQLDGYVLGSANDPLVTVKDRGYLLAIDKTLGHMVLHEHRARPEHIRDRIRSYKEIVGRAEPPRCECGTRPDGKSGNIQLDVKASYSPWKFCCFPNLRTFLYADGPRFLVKTHRKPEVIEVDKHGRVVYN